MIFVGNDWAEGHHDVYLMDEEGTRLGYARLPEGIEGVARLHEMVASHASEASRGGGRHWSCPGFVDSFRLSGL